MQDRIVFLGSKGGPAVRHPDAMPSATLLQLAGRTIVVDCGIGVTRALVSAGVALTAIDAVFITHLHSDHVLELGPLIHTAWTTGLKRPVKVFGPSGLADYWQGFMASMAFDNTIRVEDEGRVPLDDLISIEICGPGEVTTLGGIAVDALRVDHPPVKDCFALRFHHDGRTIVFSADTAYHAPLADFARNASVLVHEAMLQSGLNRLVERTDNAAHLMQHLTASHSLATEAARIAAQADVEHLCLNHLIPADDPLISAKDFLIEARSAWDGRTTIVHDGLELLLHSNGA